MPGKEMERRDDKHEGKEEELDRKWYESTIEGNCKDKRNNWYWQGHQR